MPAAQWPAPTAQLPAPGFAEGVLSTAEETGEALMLKTPGVTVLLVTVIVDSDSTQPYEVCLSPGMHMRLKATVQRACPVA